MSRDLSKKSFHLDLPKYLKDKTTHNYNLRPRRKRVNYSETHAHSSHQKMSIIEDAIQIDLTDSSCSQQSSRTSLQQELQDHDPVELVTHFFNENFRDTSIIDMETNELEEKNKGLVISSNNEENTSDVGDFEANQEPLEKQSVETVKELQEVEGTKDAYQESYLNNTNECENYQLDSSNDVDEDIDDEEEESRQEFHLNDINEDENLDVERSNVVVENEENLTDSDSEDVRFRFSRASDYSWGSPSIMQNDIDPWANISEFDTNAMGDGTHIRPNFLQVYVNFFDEEDNESDRDEGL